MSSMTPSDPKQPRADDGALSRSDEERTRIDCEQMLSDAVRSGVGDERRNADREQRGFDCGQIVGDRDPASGGDLGVPWFSRDVRQRASRGREQTAQSRLDIAARRDEMGVARDLAAARRDEIAEGRDRTMADLDAAFEQCFGPVAVTASEIVMRFGEHRKFARKYREQAAAHRALAAADRRTAAMDRLQAAHDRLLAAADREALACQIAKISATG
jgi:hypothetical protein